jgi:hypothetical protein
MTKKLTHDILKQDSSWDKDPIVLNKEVEEEKWDEDRIDNIGQNGNDGDHYDE